MKRMKMAVSLVLTVMILSSLCVSFARASDQIDSYNITVAAIGGGQIRVTATIAGTHPRMTQIGFPVISLYEWNSTTSKWVTKSSVTSQYAYSGGSHSYQFIYSGTVGKLYYAGASFFAQDSLGSDSRSKNSVSMEAT